MAAAAAPAARAAVKTWVGGNLPWDTAPGWSPAGVPLAADQARITQAGAVVQYQNPTTPAGLLAQLSVDSPVLAPTLVMSGGQLTPGEVEVGRTGKGAITQSGGVHSVTGANGLWLGQTATGEGTYSLSGTGALNVTAQLRVGGAGAGTFNLSGGSVSGSILVVNGSSTVHHTGGTATFTNNTVLQGPAGTSPAYNLSGAAVLNGEDLFVGGGTGGTSGTAEFTQTGGTITLTGVLRAGSSSGYGRYTISAGSVTSGGMSVGQLGAGDLQQTGGTVVSNAALLIGMDGGPAGRDAYELHGGSVTSQSARIAHSGTLLQSAGTFHTGALTLTGAGRIDLLGGTFRVSSIAMNPSESTIDLNDRQLLVDYAGATPLNLIRQRVQGGYAGGGWDGTGITSSVAAATAGSAVGYGEASALLGLSGAQTAAWYGHTVDATSVLVRYTLAGDATLDGLVDFNDLVALAQNYETANKVWTEGDFTYDGAVDFNDLVKLAQNYDGALPAGPVPGAPAAFASDLAAAFASVPEPSSALSAIAACGIAGARRARRHPQRGRQGR
jgi:hypothetical protein